MKKSLIKPKKWIQVQPKNYKKTTYINELSGYMK